MTIKMFSALGLVALGSIAGFSSNAYAAAGPPTSEQPGPVAATFEGRTITLASSWQGATACLIWRSHGVAQCFVTDAELIARENQLRPGSSTSITSAAATRGTDLVDSSTCSSSLDLYSGSNYSGLHLALWDEGYWQELSDYGFDKATRSFLGGACSFHLAQGDYGQGYWYPGDTGAWSFAPDMGSWDNTISSVYVN